MGFFDNKIKEQFIPVFSNVQNLITNYYPPGSKCKALRLWVNLILLYFIRIFFVYEDYFFNFDVGVGVDVDVDVCVGVDVDGALFSS